jgi:hypothetical protein
MTAMILSVVHRRQKRLENVLLRELKELQKLTKKKGVRNMQR